MRSVIPFDTEVESSSLDKILAKYDWMIDGAPNESGERREFWRKEIDKVSAEELLQRHKTASLEQLAAEREQLSSFMTQPTGAVFGQNSTSAEDLTFGAGNTSTTQLSEAPSNNGHGPAIGSAVTLVSLAADEAREILFHVSRYDQAIARITFQYPIFHRQTQTFGSVHYEPNRHHSTIRLKNGQSEKLKIATERLVEDLIRGGAERARSVRIMNVLSASGARLRSMWFRSPHRRRRIVFERIKVLEPRRSVEAFSGTVVPQRTLASVVRERRNDLILAAVFLTTGITISILSSPVIYNFDYKVHSEAWINGWLAWGSGNLSRVGSALFVASFLPVMQTLLHWMAIRRRPSVLWHIDIVRL